MCRSLERKERTICQAGKGVVVGEILEVRRRVMHAAHVGAYPDVVLRLAVFVAHGADADPLRRDLAALAAIPDLAAPVA